MTHEPKGRKVSRATQTAPAILTTEDEDGVRILAEGCRHVPPNGGSGRLLSVVLPVKNAGIELRELLPRILSQRCDDDIEIIAVDSGSEDDTVEILRAFGATVLSINPGSFNYGLTRNLAARRAAGEYLIFVTARSLPADDRWLTNLVAPLVRDDRVAGVFSRSFPRADADLLTRRDDLYWTGLVQRLPHVREIHDRDGYQRLSSSSRFELIIFSNVSAAIRSTIFAHFPFPKTTHGEDMLWARAVLEAGFKVCYEPTSVVLRSHRYSFPELFRRNFDAGVSASESADMRPELIESAESVIGTILSDWLYLEHGCRLDTHDYDQWRIAAVLHRAAQIMGFCLGANAEFLPNNVPELVAMVERGAVSETVRSYARLLRQSINTLSPYDGASRPVLSVDDMMQEIQAAWQEIQSTDHPHGDLQTLELDSALTRILRSVAEWFRADPARLTKDFKSSFSLIAAIKTGALTQEMRDGLHCIPLLNTDPAKESVTPAPWHGDTQSMLATVDAYEAEWRTALARVDTMRNSYEAEIQHREGVIRELQAAMTREIEHRDETIWDLRATMDREIEQRDRVIADLSGGRAHLLPNADLGAQVVLLVEELQTRQREIDSIYRSKAWRAANVYWSAQRRLKKLITNLSGYGRNQA